MKSKKLISWISALAITASAFAGLTISASAEDVSVWSETFNGYQEGVFLNATSEANLSVSDYIDGVTFVGSNRDDGDRGFYVNTNGETVRSGSYYSIETKSSEDKYLRLSYPHFGDFLKSNANRWAHVDFTKTDATSAQDVVLDFDLKLTDGVIQGVTSEANANQTNPVFRLGTFDGTAHTANAIDINKDAANIGDGWVHARVIITASGATAYIDGTQVSTAETVTSFETIGLYSADGNSNITPPLDARNDWLNADAPTKTPIADVDNFIIYTATAGETTATSKAPGAETGETDVTPPPEATPFVVPAAPALTAPSAANADTLQSYDFDAAPNFTLTQGDEAKEDTTSVPGVSFYVGGRNGGGWAQTYAGVVNTKIGKAAQLTANRFSTAGKSPRISFTNDLPISDGVTTALAFEVYLNAIEGHEEDAEPRLYILKDTDQGGEDNAGAFRNIAAVLTTVEGEKIYREPGNTDSDVISVYVTPNQWHKVTFTVTPTSEGATHRVYVDDDKDNASMNSKYVYYGDAATHMEGLPILAVEYKAAKVNGEDTSPNYGMATIDNILAYQGTVDNPKELIAGTGAAPTEPPATATPVPSHDVKVEYDGTTAKVTTTETTPFDAVLINASYYTDGTLESLVTYPIKGLSATSAYEQAMTAKKGGKLLVWNSLDGMLPYGKLDPVTNGADQPVAPTAAPAVSTDAPAVATDAPAVSTDAPAVSTDAPAVSTDAPAVPTNAPTLAPTAVPTAVPTDEPKDDSYTAPLVHTASAAWASAVGSASKTVDKEKEYFNNDADSGWAGTAFMQFDLSEMPAAISDATVKFTVSSGKAYPVVVYYLTENPDLSTVPAQSAESRFTSARTLIKDAGNSANGDKEFELDVTDAVKAMASSGKITFMLTGNNGSANLYGKGSADKAPTLTMTAVSADAKATKYTVKYVDSNGTELKTAAERDGYSTLKYAATDEDKASFTVGEGEEAKKYIYVSGGDEITAVEDAASNVIAITFKEAAKVTYTVKSSLGDTISTKELFEADSYTYTYPKYITDANHKVTAEYSGEDAVFGKTITAGAEDTTITVDYTAYAGTAYFLDYETVSTTNTVQQLTTLSNGYGARVLVNASAEEIAPVFTVAEAGNYNVSVVAFGRNSSTDSAFGVYKNDATDANTLLTGSVTTSQNKPTTIATEAAVSIAANDNILLVGDTGNTNIDYILAVKAD